MSWSAIKWAMVASQHARLTTVQRVVLLTLAYHHNAKSAACTPSVDTLRAETGLSRRAVQIAVQALEASGLITVTARNKKNVQTSNQYNLFRSANGRTMCAGGAQETEQRGAHVMHPNLNSPTSSSTNVTAFPVQRRAML